MDRTEVIASIQERVRRCRRLAVGLADEAAADALRQMADEGEETIRRLESEGLPNSE